MIIELSYWDMFWVGVTVGWILCWYVPLLLNIGVRSNRMNQSKPNYLKPAEFKYQPTQYFKHVPVKELRLGNQGEMPSKPTSEMPSLKEPKKSPPLPDYNPNK